VPGATSDRKPRSAYGKPSLNHRLDIHTRAFTSLRSGTAGLLSVCHQLADLDFEEKILVGMAGQLAPRPCGSPRAARSAQCAGRNETTEKTRRMLGSLQHHTINSINPLVHLLITDGSHGRRSGKTATSGALAREAVPSPVQKAELTHSLVAWGKILADRTERRWLRLQLVGDIAHFRRHQRAHALPHLGAQQDIV
jgi:hypothetical protein